ncbi:MAG: Hsp20/alpha crystallin family protein [Dehalococcoidales bacterium]|nr:Hsp20/alpha crystallin family protein [Dehalococcoidales bacterium]
MLVQRWDPFRDLTQMEDTVNRLWRGLGGVPSYREGVEDWNILIDVIQKGDELVVKASIPGIKPDEIDVAVEDNLLTLRAERKADSEGEQSRYLIQERPTGSFYRALRLPQTVDTNKIESEYENGVLIIRMPKAEEKKKKQIQIKVGGSTKAIEGSSKK